MAVLPGDTNAFISSLIKLAEHLLKVRPFIPDDSLPSNWRTILAGWVSGKSVQTIGPDNLRFIEDAFIYRLVWAIEAIRTRRVMLGWQPEIIAGTAAACLETGLPRYTMAMLVRAGLPSRTAALAAINDQEPALVDNDDLIEWLETDEVIALTSEGSWPTSETSDIWNTFRTDMLKRTTQRWSAQDWIVDVDPLMPQMELELNRIYRMEFDEDDDSWWVLAPDFKQIVRLLGRGSDQNSIVLTARAAEGIGRVAVRGIGPT